MRKINTLTDTADNNAEFTDGDAAVGIQPTILPAEWFNTIQRELAAVVTGAGMELDSKDDEQLNKIISKMSSVITHYRNYGYPDWESTIPYYDGAVVYYNDGLYLSLSDNNLAHIPGTDDSVWQPYIQREATTQEAILGAGSTQVITPRRLHAGASYLDEQLKDALIPQLVEVGMGALWFTDTPPDGWLEANGQEFDVIKYPKLAMRFPSGRVPDARGRFLRAWANGSSVDPDSNRTINSLQEDAIRNISGQFKTFDYSSDSPTGVFSHVTRASALVSGNFHGWYHSIVNMDASKQVPTAEENRPKNIAVMIIIKTDLAESGNDESNVPTALVISPATITLNAGTTRQFASTTLPTSLAGAYPVSWSVSDSSLGSIDSNGLYKAIAGQSGTQTIIASLSTGLTQTATVTQHIYLTSITVSNVPNELLADNSYVLSINYLPARYTEVVNASSSDASVATLLSDGSLIISGKGRATLSLIGASSGVTASITITATEEEVPEVYLQIAENLSEIKDAGETALTAARNNLGLKALATKDGLNATDVAAVPQDTESLGSKDLNTVLIPGRKFQSLTSNATAARHYPVVLAGMLDVIKTSATGIRQIFYPYNTTDVYHRYCVDTTATTLAFSDWLADGADAFLAVDNNLSDVPDVSAARNNLGVGYTISTEAAPSSASGYAVGHIWYQVEE